MELIDTHIHLDSADFASDLDQVIERGLAAGIVNFISVGAGYGADSAGKAIAIAEKYPCVYATVGIHPHDAATAFDPDFLRPLAAHPKVVAIGETGLDFYQDWSPRDRQEMWFRAQIETAIEAGKPLVIHSRDAGEECLRILKETGAEKTGGVFHCYAEDQHFAERLREINFMVSIPGTVTFKKADRLREIVRAIPLDQLMLETDGPYMAPEPYRGKRCESAYMTETAKAIAKVKGIGPEELAKITTENAKKFFRIP